MDDLIIILVLSCLTTLFAVGFVVLIAGRPSFTSFPSEVQTAAFRFISMPSFTPSYLGGKLNQIELRRQHIAAKRERAASIEDVALRRCIELYLDYHERKLPEEEHELVERISHRASVKFNTEQVKHRLAVEDILRKAGLDNVIIPR